MNIINSELEWLFGWFYKQCDGDWEHGRGIQIGTSSNPGWFIKIDIEETDLHDKKFQKIFIERSEKDWVYCNKQNGFFEGDCGPFNLPEVLKIFREWAEG
jgi:hypothetical protein